jgi:two-component sensor histidine kinase
LIKTNLNNFDLKVTENYSDIGVNIHPFLLIKICKELLDNCFKYAKGSDVEVILDQKYSKLTDTENSEFIFSQNSSAKGKPAKGLETVEKILNDFRGSIVYDDSKSDKLQIQIQIPVTKYKFNSHG